MAKKESGGEMIYREMGSTGETVSAIGVGGHHLGLKSVSEKIAVRIVHEAIERGINFFDNSWDYNEGRSEKRLGKALKDGRREKVFLMTKIDGRTKKIAAQQIEESLKRLKTDCIDLVQHHEILRFEDPNRIFDDKDGANLAMLEAQKAGKLRYIGFTGHKDPRIHLYMLEVAAEKGFKFDAAQMPVNLMDAHFRSFTNLVLPELVKQKIGVLAMKTMANGAILKSKTVTPVECLHFALNQPTSVVICGIDSLKILDQAFKAVKTFKPLTQKQTAALLEKTKDAAMQGKFEPFKTTSIFDSTVKNPEWLGDEPKRIQNLMRQ
ncbi:MAG TPA: aldo/keto reductase [Pyrinomonadaceae bacterium]|nr:aldo/keto reductase [Pyrinomonadaceae bacterium]